MAATPYPQNLFHTGTARPLELDQGLQPPASGDIVFTVAGNAAAQGWPAVPTGQKMVVTVGRGTQYEHKLLVSSVSSGQASSTFTVLAADRYYDGSPSVDSPAGTTVEHTVSATEMATINDHMRTKQAHGSDGEIVDQNSTQTMSNKTLVGSTLTDPVLAGARFTPIGAIIAWPNNQVPEGFLACNGQSITQVAYPELFALVGATVPNLVDRFIKGGSTINTTVQGAASKTIELANLPAHKHDVAVGATQAAHSHGGTTWWGGGHSHTASVTIYAATTYTAVTKVYNTIQGGGERTVVGAEDSSVGHSHGGAVTVNGVGDHQHAIAAEAPPITVSVTEATKGSGTPFNVEPAHIVLQYIICAKPQGT